MIERTVKVMASNITLGRSRDLYIRRRRTSVGLAGAAAAAADFKLRVLMRVTSVSDCKLFFEAR